MRLPAAASATVAHVFGISWSAASGDPVDAAADELLPAGPAGEARDLVEVRDRAHRVDERVPVAGDAAEPEADPVLCVRDLCEAPFLRICDAGSEHVVEGNGGGRRLAQRPEDVVGGRRERELHRRHDDPAAGDVGRIRRLVREPDLAAVREREDVDDVARLRARREPGEERPVLREGDDLLLRRALVERLRARRSRPRMQDGGRESERREHRSHRLKISPRVLGRCVRRGLSRPSRLVPSPSWRPWFFASFGELRERRAPPGRAAAPRRARPEVREGRAHVRRRAARPGRVARPPERRLDAHAPDAVDRAEHPDRLGGDGHGHARRGSRSRSRARAGSGSCTGTSRSRSRSPRSTR